MDRKEEVDVVDLKAYSDASQPVSVCAAGQPRVFVVRTGSAHTRPIKFCLRRANTLIKQPVSSAIKSVSRGGQTWWER